MATVQLATRKNGGAECLERGLSVLRGRAAMRLLSAERSEEIFPILLEEIVALGHPRALVAAIDFESGQLKPVAALNCSKQHQQRANTSLYAAEHPLVKLLRADKPAILTRFWPEAREVFCCPFTFRLSNPCWEVERERRGQCMGLANYRSGTRLGLDEQVCGLCRMAGYVGVVAVELASTAPGRDPGGAQALIYVAQQHFSRRFKVEHYYNRMSDMEAVIARQDAVMEGMSDPVVLTDTQQRVVTLNRAAGRFFRVPEGVSEGHAHAVELNNLLFSAALSFMTVSGAEAPHDLTLVDPIEGEELLFEAVTRPTFDRDSMRTGMVTVLRDVTDLRRADEELRANYERLREAEETVRQDRDRLNLIVENVGDPIVVCDSAAVPVFMDRRAQELFGAGKERRASPAQLRNLAKLNAFVSGFSYSFLDKHTGSLRLETGSGVEIDFDVRSGKIYTERGQVAFTVSVLRDLTAVRTLEQLKLEQRMLQIEKFAAAGRLAGTIAHELNNPMEAIKNAIHLLGEAIPESARPIHDILASETDRVIRITRQMLGLYRAGEQVGSVDVNSIVQDTVALFGRQLLRANIRLITELGQLPELLGSADQLRQLFSNLLINAKDSMPGGGKLIIRTALRRLAGQPRIRLLIADTGCGIPSHLLGSIFEPFVTTKGEKGTGLGLWIVKGAVENHAGKIAVRSKVGMGTVFRIDLPLARPVQKT